MKNVKAFGAIRFIFTLIAIFLVLILGVKGHSSNTFSFFERLYATFQMFIMGGGEQPDKFFNIQIMIARYIAAILAGLGILTLLYDFLYLSYKILKIQFCYSSHYIICGLGEISYRLIKDLQDKEPNSKIVVIELNPDSNYIDKVGKKAIILFGNAMNERILNFAGVKKASNIIIATGFDDLNIKIANFISDLEQKRKRNAKLTCILHIDNWNNINVLKDNLEFFHDSKNKFFDLIIYNMYQACAQIIFDKYGPHIVKNKFDPTNVCIAIFGYNKTTEAFLLENMILGQYHPINKMKIFLIEKNISKYLGEFKQKFPFYSKYLEIIPIELEDNSFNLPELTKNAASIQRCYVFNDNDAIALERAKLMRQFFYTSSNMELTVPPIVVCLYEEVDFIHSFETNSKNSFEKKMEKKLGISLVYLVSDTCTKEKLIKERDKIEKLAKIINYYYCDQKVINNMVRENKFSKDVLDDLPLDEKWKNLSDRLKDSNRYAARHIKVKTLLIGKNNVENKDELLRLIPIEHNRWCAEKEIFGYRYGTRAKGKDSEINTAKELLKIHSSIVEFDQLSQSEKNIDYNIFRIAMLINENIKND